MNDLFMTSGLIVLGRGHLITTWTRRGGYLGGPTMRNFLHIQCEKVGRSSKKGRIVST